MRRHCAVDAALANNWEEMSGTRYNMQPYTNVFTSWCFVGGRMRLEDSRETGPGIKKNQEKKKPPVTLSWLLSGNGAVLAGGGYH